ncbi:uncharacterized protein FIBRA_06540 [Fibroporia radiculosa]|uniref:E3 ubiquitin-protein ligase synoviolin-like TPR repeats domain-containing protein n=1 Tax=Fibroporia radiculosa TaxID=599839 RepID=J4HZ99_9APHY|nr:uncharacterized protein FIBRA_06540 [Fibroporia radiculosa]CCM04367.1 predicted protein [Fibroporia radiculosa]
MPVPDIVRQRLQPLSALLTSNRILLYTVFSSCAVVGTVANACRSYPNFYSVAIYLSRSSRSVLVLANFGLLLALLFGRILQRLFFGPLQPREVERLYDQTWIFVTESLLAFTIFRDDFDIPFVLMFGFLLFVKCFHWLMADRVETMDQTTYPGPPVIFHIRMNMLFCLLWGINIVMFSFAVESTLTHGVGGMVLFASEYAILMASALNAMARYILSLIDIRRARQRGGENAPPMENKSMYVFYIELVTDFLKLATYLVFFMLILTFYGLPLNIVRDVYLTARSFITRLRALVRYRNATRDMDRRYPDANETDLSEMSDRTCIICREEMVSRNHQPLPGAASAEPQAPTHHDGPNMTPKKLPCGHIFHFHRRTVLETDTQNQPQTQDRPGARPAPPQPGAGPQPGPLAQAWLGRFFGVPAQPGGLQGPLVPGQFPPGGLPQQQQPQQQVPNAGWVPGQAPPFYIPVHYPPQGQQQQQLPQPPFFRGFHGPGGAWQPWGMDPQWFGPPQPGQAPAQNPPQTQPPPTQEPTGVVPGPTPTVPSEPGPAPAPTASASSSASELTPALTPREAAMQAAIRRLGSSQSTSSARDGSSRGPAAISAGQTESSRSTDPNTSAASEPSSGPTSTETGPPLTQPTQTGTRLDVPSLVPLFDVSPAGAAARAATLLPPSYGSHTSPFSRSQGQNASMVSQAPSAHSSHPQAGSSRFPRTSAPVQTHLPPTLTDQQLAQLDRLTRDAIDERLRVLEGVSNTVYRCIEELSRVRSVLPTSPSIGSAPPQGQERSAASTTATTNLSGVAGGSAASPAAVEPVNATSPTISGGDEWSAEVGDANAGRQNEQSSSGTAS